MGAGEGPGEGCEVQEGVNEREPQAAGAGRNFTTNTVMSRALCPQVRSNNEPAVSTANHPSSARLTWSVGRSGLDHPNRACHLKSQTRWSARHAWGLKVLVRGVGRSGEGTSACTLDVTASGFPSRHGERCAKGAERKHLWGVNAACRSPTTVQLPRRECRGF